MRPARTIVLALTVALALAAGARAQNPPAEEENPIEKLKEIQQIMAEIEKDLAKASLDQKVQADERWVEEQIEKLVRSGKDEAEVARQIERLFEKAGKDAGKSREEIEKLVKALKSQAEAGQKMEDLEKAQEEVARKLRELFQSLEKAQSAVEKMEKLFEESGTKQKEVIDRIQTLIDTAKRMKMSGQGQPQEKPEEEKEGKEPKDKEQAENPQKEDNTAEKDEDPGRKPNDPRKEKEEEKLTPPEKAGRWGDMQRIMMEQGRTSGRSGRLPGYGELANEYFKRIMGDEGKRGGDEGRDR